jgi:hypothetical protein
VIENPILVLTLWRWMDDRRMIQERSRDDY